MVWDSDVDWLHSPPDSIFDPYDLLYDRISIKRPEVSGRYGWHDLRATDNQAYVAIETYSNLPKMWKVPNGPSRDPSLDFRCQWRARQDRYRIAYAQVAAGYVVDQNFSTVCFNDRVAKENSELHQPPDFDHPWYYIHCTIRVDLQ
jgi:hypothetical protein